MTALSTTFGKFWNKVDDAPLNQWVLISDGEDIDIGIMYESSRSYWEQVSETRRERKTEVVRYWSRHSDDWLDVKYWMELPELPPKPPEDQEKAREKALLGI